MKMIRYFIVLLVLVFSSCKNQGNQNASVKTVSVVSQMDQLKLGMDSSWQNMMSSDVSKFDNMTRLVQELKLIDGSDVAHLDGLAEKIKQMESVRYNPETMSETGRIDQFDSVTNSIWADLRTEVLKNKNAEKYQIVNQLITEIQQADDSVLFYRKNYDRKVDQFNLFYKKNKKELKRSYPEFDSVKPYPVFRLGK